jgi:hypothetical protein
MTEFEIFRITPTTDGKCYEYAESTRREGRYPKERYFTKTQPLYVGHLVRSETGGYGDGGWRRDYFQDNEKEHIVNYSYEGNTCFREVPCRPTLIQGLDSSGGRSRRIRRIRKNRRSKKNRISKKNRRYKR